MIHHLSAVPADPLQKLRTQTPGSPGTPCTQLKANCERDFQQHIHFYSFMDLHDFSHHRPPHHRGNCTYSLSQAVNRSTNSNLHSHCLLGMLTQPEAPKEEEDDEQFKTPITQRETHIKVQVLRGERVCKSRSSNTSGLPHLACPSHHKASQAGKVSPTILNSHHLQHETLIT